MVAGPRHARAAAPPPVTSGLPKPVGNRAPHRTAAAGRYAASRRRSASPRRCRCDRGSARRPERRPAPEPLRRGPERPERAAQTGSPGVDAMAVAASTPATAAAPSAAAATARAGSAASAGEPASVKQDRLAWRMIDRHDMIAPAGERHCRFVGSGMRQANFIAPSRTQMSAAVKSWNTRCAENSTGWFQIIARARAAVVRGLPRRCREMI